MFVINAWFIYLKFTRFLLDHFNVLKRVKLFVTMRGISAASLSPGGSNVRRYVLQLFFSEKSQNWPSQIFAGKPGAMGLKGINALASLSQF